MRFVNLGSSSEGNCYWIELERSSGGPVKIMVEAGIEYGGTTGILSRMINTVYPPIDISECRAVLITHGHSDHAKSARKLADRGFKIYGNSYVCSSPNCEMHPDTPKFIAADIKVTPFLVEHDAPDSYGYVIETDVEKILFVADCKFWQADLSRIPFDYIVIESNYDGQTIHYALKTAEENNDFVSVSAYKRILNSHMSIANCITMLRKLNLSRCKAIYLIHLSDRHANANLFKKSVQEATGIPCYVCGKNGGIM